MTNHYFPGHPRRSESNSLVLAEGPEQTVYEHRRRPRTDSVEQFNWTLNQVELLIKPPTDRRVDVLLETVTPNFDHFEIVVNGVPITHRSSTFRWELQEGANTIAVRPVNRWNVKGIPTRATVVLSTQQKDYPNDVSPETDGTRNREK